MMQMAQMAQMSMMAAAASGADPSNPSDPAASQASMMQQMMGNMIMGANPAMPGLSDGSAAGGAPRRDSAVTNNFTTQSFQQQQFQKQMKSMMTNMQIARTVATSDTLNNLTDDQVEELSDKKFTNAKEFMNFMKSATTEVKRNYTCS